MHDGGHLPKHPPDFLKVTRAGWHGGNWKPDLLSRTSQIFIKKLFAFTLKQCSTGRGKAHRNNPIETQPPELLIAPFVPPREELTGLAHLTRKEDLAGSQAGGDAAP